MLESRKQMKKVRAGGENSKNAVGSTSHKRGVTVGGGSPTGSVNVPTLSRLETDDGTRARRVWAAPNREDNLEPAAAGSVNGPLSDEIRTCNKDAPVQPAESINSPIAQQQVADTAKTGLCTPAPSKPSSTENRSSVISGGADRINFVAEQRRDGSLKELFERAESGTDPKLFIEAGVLYRRPLDGVNGDKLLVLPAKYRNKVIDLAHESEWSGHRGKRTTYHRVANLFFWPRMLTQIAQRLRTCKQCQLIAPNMTRDRVPLQEVPVVTEVFFRFDG